MALFICKFMHSFDYSSSCDVYLFFLFSTMRLLVAVSLMLAYGMRSEFS